MALKVVIGGSALGLIPFTYYVWYFATNAPKEAPEGYTEFTHYTDFWICCVSAVVFMAIEKTFMTVLPAIVGPICKTQEDPNDPTKALEKQRRVKKMSSMIYKSCFFTFSASWGYSIMRNTDWLPRNLGGIGDIKNLWNNYPYAKHEKDLALYL